MDPTTTPSNAQYVRFKHLASLTFLVTAPILIALPPRKLDVYTIALGTGFVLSANHLTVERTNRSILANVFPSALPTPTAQAIAASNARAREMEGQREKQGLNNIAERVWMGGEKEGWKERRLREERERLAEGEGYGDMIKDQIWEVWNWGRRDETGEEARERAKEEAEKKGKS